MAGQPIGASAVEAVIMKYLARRLARRARDKLADSDGWFALAVFLTILVPVVVILTY